MRFHTCTVLSVVCLMGVFNPGRVQAEERVPVLPTTYDHQNEGDPGEGARLERDATVGRGRG